LVRRRHLFLRVRQNSLFTFYCLEIWGVRTLYYLNTEVTREMDAGVRQKRVEALEKIKDKAMEMAKTGRDSLEVRDFVTEAKKELAYELPDEDAFRKAVGATKAYMSKKQK
jgi:uncharacterized protein YpuA (DUF1002 family)